HLLIGAFGTVALCEETYYLLCAHRARQRRQCKLCRCRFAIWPLYEQPDWFVLVVCHLHSAERKTGTELAAPARHRSVAPCHTPKRLFPELLGDATGVLGLCHAPIETIETPHR